MSELLTGLIIQKTEEFVKESLEGDSGHDWWHIERVRNTALTLAKEENANELIVELAALLHDIADHKFHGGDELLGARVAKKWLRNFPIPEDTTNHVCEIIARISFKGAKVSTPMESIEGKVVQDADRLDAIGAIGIARAFSYGGFKRREMYNPGVPPVMHSSFEAYKNSQGHTINHFYEKLFLLKDRMNTASGKKMAEERHNFMIEYVDRFKNEWKGLN